MYVNVNLLAWVMTIPVAAVFVMAGSLKLTTPRSELLKNTQMGWVDSFGAWQVKVLGALEVLGAIGVVVPWAFGIVPVLTPLAAVGLGAMMWGAMVVHALRHEWGMLPVNFVLAALPLGVAALRFSQL